MSRENVPVNLVTAERIKERRKECGYTQAELGNKVGVSEQVIRGYERGKNGVTRAMVIALASVLRCPVVYLEGAIDPLDFAEMTGGEKRRWIPAKEKRPDFAQYLCVVLRPIPGGSYVREFRVLWCDYDNKWACEDLIVTHWMPLPEFPKEV